MTETPSTDDGRTDDPTLSRMTIVVNVEDSPLEQITKQLNKLIEVIKIVELDNASSVAREIWEMSREAVRLTAELVERHAIPCDLSWGYLHAAVKRRHIKELCEFRDRLAREVPRDRVGRRRTRRQVPGARRPLPPGDVRGRS